MKNLRLSHMKLSRKIMLLSVGAQLFLVGTAALLGLGVLGSHHSLLAESTLNYLNLASGNLSESLDEIDALTYTMLGDSEIQSELSSIALAEDAQTRYASYHTLYNKLIRYEQESRKLGVRKIGLETRAYTVTTSYRTPEEEFGGVIDQLISGAEQSNGQTVFYTGLGHEKRLFAARAVRQISPFDLAVTGTILLEIDLDRLATQATDLDESMGGLYWVMDSDGETFYHSDALDDGDLMQVLKGAQDAPRVISLKNGHYFVCHGQLTGVADWGYTLLIDYERQWREQVRSYVIFLLTLIGAMLFAAWLTRAMVRSITGEIDALLEKMNTFQRQLTKDGLDIPSAGDASENEIAVLHRHFDSMAARIRDLIEQRYVSELLAREAQLQALEEQMNPHFLYNVLESINCRARLAGSRDVAAIVEALGRLLRVSLDRHSKTIRLRDELSLVHDYIFIQKQRYEDGLDYTDSVPEELMDVALPKLVIQPLIENAIKYALENGIDDVCRIEVQARREGDGMVISVVNSGSVFPDDMLGVLRPENIVSHGFGIGLANIHQRLQLTYGDRGYLALENRDDMAVCLLTIPVRRDTTCCE